MSGERGSIGIGLMGLGVVGGGVARILQDKAPVYARQIGCELSVRRVLVRDLSKERDAGVDRALLTTNPDDLLGDPSIGIIIEMMGAEEPAYSYLRRALEAGKQVFCEKPLALTAASAERILAASEKSGGVLGIGHERRYEPAMEEIRRLFDSGALGRVLHMDANVSHNNFRKMDPANWRRDARHAPAGAWTALGIHLGDMFVSLAGKPVRVAARTASQVFPAPSEDFVSAEIDFENGARGRITCLSTPPFYGRFTLVCDQGWVETQEGGNVDKSIPSSFVYCGPDGARHTRNYEHANTVRMNFEAWADALEDRVPYRFTSEQLLANIRILDAVTRSAAADGKPIAL